MNLPDYKLLKKLADTCRKAGIRQFKNSDFEFTLTDDAPVSAYKKRLLKPQVKENYEPAAANILNDHELTEDALLFWSANPGETNDAM